jgi:hypothetical protein
VRRSSNGSELVLYQSNDLISIDVVLLRARLIRLEVLLSLVLIGLCRPSVRSCLRLYIVKIKSFLLLPLHLSSVYVD